MVGSSPVRESRTMDQSWILPWFGLAKAIAYGACALVALAYYLVPACRERMPKPFGYFVGGLFLMAVGESLGYIWHSHLRSLAEVAVSANVLLIVGTCVAVGSVTAMSVMYRRTAGLLRKQAETDPLTGLYNRRAFFDALEARLARARGCKQDRFAVAVLDLDCMKEINDTLGHLAGDEALRMAAEAIRRSVRETDLACRYGGDEFAVLFATNGPSPAAFTMRLRGSAAELLDSSRHFHISFSVGIAYYPDDGATTTELVSAADRRMYEDKRGGRSCSPGLAAYYLGRPGEKHDVAPVQGPEPEACRTAESARFELT